MAVKIPNYHKTYKHLPLQDPPKIYPNWNFWFENIPSGNPVHDLNCGKSSPKSPTFEKLPKSKQSHNEQKFAESGHPARAQKDVLES
jgi:hypothetical protein